MSAPTARRRSARSLAAEKLFRDRVAELGGQVIGGYAGAHVPVDCRCKNGHPCRPRPNSLRWGQGMCRACAGTDPVTAESAFRTRVAELGGQIIGDYRNVMTAVACRCSQGHRCAPTPNSLQQGRGLCRACAGKDPAATEAAFRRRVAESGGQMIGQYAGANTPVDCVCPAGHRCRPSPNSLRDGKGMCRVCSGMDPATAEAAFRARIAQDGGRVIGQYLGNKTPVECICAEGHLCQPRPNDIQQGHGMCRVCVRLDPVAAETAFRARVAEVGGEVVGAYAGAHTPVTCICAAGHLCRPHPGSLRIGQGLCAQCKGREWNVFYVVVNPTTARLKFGITSNDPRPRLTDHRYAGYTTAVRVLPDLPDAPALERHVRATLAAADIPAVRGREYFHVDALAVVLDVVDGWVAA